MENNKAQDRVIGKTEGQLIVVACPGSGKTTTLLRRIDHMVHDRGIEPEHILMITFTSAAAKEMRTRYERDYEKNGVTFCTIHSLCMAILRKFKSLNNESILVDASDFFYEKLRYNNIINDKTDFIKTLMTDISVVKNNFLDYREYLPKCSNDKVLFRELYEGYETYKEELGLIDFDDMLTEAYEEMMNNPFCLEWLQKKYRYIQVDEYQDTNYLQRDIVYLLAGDNGNLAVVGDDDQSIYGFRGARPDVMLQFKEHYPNAEEIKLSTNYRSSSKIIAHADQLIKKNKKRFSKQFLAFHKSDGAVEEVHCDDRNKELYSVALKIKGLIKEGVALTDIAILFRTNQQAEAIAGILQEAKIPFMSNEKIQSCYNHWMLEDVKSFKRLTEDTWKKKDLSRVLNHPQRFLLGKDYLNCGLDMAKMRNVASRIKVEWKRNNAYDEITSFFYLLRVLQGKKPFEFLSMMEKTGTYKKYLGEYAAFRNENVDDLMWIWDRYKKDASEHNNWTDWGRYIIGYNMKLEESQNQKDGVMLSTMHCSKGLEWKYVFIIDCVKGICPHKNAETDEEIEEERRLFYVAMTRAKENLYLYSYKQKRKGATVRISPFVLEQRL